MLFYVAAENLEAADAAHEKGDHEQLEANVEKDVYEASRDIRPEQSDELVTLVITLAQLRLFFLQNAVALNADHEHYDAIEGQAHQVHPKCVPEANEGIRPEMIAENE